MWENIVQQGRPQTTIWRMRIASWIIKATNTHSEYAILVAFPQQQLLHECASLLRYTYRVAQKERMVFISTCDLFLWGYLKSKVYVRKPRTVDDLKVSIREEIATVPQEMLVNVIQNFEERLRTCVRQEGRHLSDIIFRNCVINVSNQNCIYYMLFWC